MKFLKNRYRAIICLCVCTMLCLVSASAVGTRTVGGDTTITVDGVTYIFRGHINYSTDGGVFAGASVISSIPLPAGSVGVSAKMLNQDSDVVRMSEVVYNTNNNRTASATSRNFNEPGTYRCIPILHIGNAEYEGIITPRLSLP